MKHTSGKGESGQSIVEFALVSLPLFLILLGIIQFGFIFNAYVTVANAAREGARAGSIFPANLNQTQGQNDTARKTHGTYGIDVTVANTLGLLNPANATTAVTYWNGASADSACPSGQPPLGSPSSWTADDARRKGHYVCVTVTYNLDLLIPMFGSTLDIGARSEMVIN